MPLTIGNTWEYVQLDVGHADTTVVRDSTIMEITATVLPADEVYFRTNWLLVFRNQSDGLSVAAYDDEQNELDEFEFLLRYPVESGDEYYYLSPKVIASPPVTITVQSATIGTYLGPLPGLRYTVRGPEQQHFMEFSFAPGVGILTLKNVSDTLWVLSSYDIQED
jgi:hypothetical protein